VKPVIYTFLFEPKQEERSLNVELLPQQCKHGHREIRHIVINVLEVTAKGEPEEGGRI
jgi:hypothetical protein